MKQNLDTLRSELEAYVVTNGFLLFRGFTRRVDEMPEVEWDTLRYPDYKPFLEVAKQLGAKLIVLHHREFVGALIDDAVDDLEGSIGYDEDGSIVRRLNELRVYDGFTCAIEMSFDHGGTMYVWELHAPWYDEFRDIRDEIDMVEGVGAVDEDDEDDDETLGGYYSKN